MSISAKRPGDASQTDNSRMQAIYNMTSVLTHLQPIGIRIYSEQWNMQYWARIVDIKSYYTTNLIYSNTINIQTMTHHFVILIIFATLQMRSAWFMWKYI